MTCTAPAARTVDTLLRTTGGRIVALRAALDDGRTVTLVADDALFSNRALRETGAGPFALGLVVPRYDRVVVDEYHHGYDASRSLGGATFDWTLRSPWGWAILQLAGRRRAGAAGRRASASGRSARGSSAGGARRWSTCARSPPRSRRPGGTTWRWASSSRGSGAGSRGPGHPLAG